MTTTNQASATFVRDAAERHYGRHEGLWVDRYDKRYLYRELYTRRNSFIRELVVADPASPRKRVLDFGCGYGDVSIMVAPHVAHVDGIDIVAHSVEQARCNAAARNISNVAFHTVDGHELPFRDGTFDIAILPDVLEHIVPQARGATLNELRRVITAGGQAVIITPDKRSIALLERIDDAATSLLPVRRPESTLHHELNFFLGVEEAKTLCKEAGFTVEGVERILFYPAPERPGAFYYLNRTAARIGLEGPFNSLFRSLFLGVERLRIFNQKVVYLLRRS